jgi:CO/xanthine dehydrogenase Mo-binding subunit
MAEVAINPLCVKGVGESGCVPAAGAIISALVEMRHY